MVCGIAAAIGPDEVYACPADLLLRVEEALLLGIEPKGDDRLVLIEDQILSRQLTTVLCLDRLVEELQLLLVGVGVADAGGIDDDLQFAHRFTSFLEQTSHTAWQRDSSHSHSHRRPLRQN